MPNISVAAGIEIGFGPGGIQAGARAMDATFKPALEAEFSKALATLRRDPYGRLPQKQAEAIVAFLAASQPSDKERLGWSFSEELDSFTRILPYVICAFNAIDRDCDALVSAEEVEFWLKKPKLEHRVEEMQWSLTDLKSVEGSLPALCISGLSGPKGLVCIMEHIKNIHFQSGVRAMALRDCVLASMKVFTELHVRVGSG
ncbi:unnamed protein product [Symbiodinium pilosum]|uniref:EF-hand domain-containing protein n=1 Tax=Symbiodinium pilosum TaxID=2952 RepID=A0A812V1W5_SYMPI|nr:unnamed protein product [Symbiodinium pilosum]